MAVLSFWRKLPFFHNRQVGEISDSDLDFEKWRDAHRAWRLRLEQMLDGTKLPPDPEVAGCDQRCALGQWLHGNAKRLYGDLVEYQLLVEEHRAFHRTAAEIIRLWQAGDARGAHRLLQGEFQLRSMRVLEDLTALERIVLKQ